jgi:shikimate kinase
MKKQKGITLMGMTGAGKSTIGPILAKKLNWKIYDVDRMIVEKKGMLLGEIVEKEGAQYLLDYETELIRQLDLRKSVLSPPGSIVFDKPCHQQLKEQTVILMLDVSFLTLSERFGKDPWKNGGIIGAENGFEGIYNERIPLCESLADVKINCNEKRPDIIADEIIKYYKRTISH